MAPWLASLPDGLATAVGEHGAKVSGGQRRRIATARLLLSGARFVIADEPAAHLDPHAATALHDELVREARSGRGVLVITHERHGLDRFDEVLTLRAPAGGPHRVFPAHDGGVARMPPAGGAAMLLT